MEAEVDGGLVTSDEESSASLVRRSSKTKLAINFRENGSNETVKQRSENHRGFVAASDEKPLDAQVRGSLMVDSDNNIEENGANRALELKRSDLTKLGQTVNSKAINEVSNGNSPSNSMEQPSNASEVSFDSAHSKAAFETSVYFAEEEGSESIEPLERGGASLDFQSEKTEFAKPENGIQTMTEIKKNLKLSTAEENQEHSLIDLETSTGSFITKSFVTSKFNHSEKREKGKNVCLDTHVFSETGSTVTVESGDLTIDREEEKAGNGGYKQHQHGNSASESTRQNLHNGALNEQDERQLKEYWTRILEKSEFEGKVEAIVKTLKEQQSHDLVCPVCRSCITERVILRKRKRTDVDSHGGWRKEATDDVQPIMSEGEHDIPENQNDREDIEAYGCLACFSLFFRRDSAKSQSGSGSSSEQHPSEVHQESARFIDREKDNFYCLPFLYGWGQSNNKASSSGASSHFPVETSQQSSVKDADSRFKIESSISISGMSDILEQDKTIAEEPTAIFVAENNLRHAGEKRAIVDKVDLNGGDTDTNEENVAVQEFGSTKTSQRTSSTAITIHNIFATTEKSQMDTTPMENTIAQAKYTSTEAINSDVSVKGKGEFPPPVKGDSEYGPQSEEFHFMTEGQVVQPPFDIGGSLDDKIRQEVGKNKVLNESAPVKQWEKQPLYQEGVKGTEDQRPELHFNEEENQLKTAQFGRYESGKPLQMPAGEIDAITNEDGIRPHLNPQDHVLNNSSTVRGDGELATSDKETSSLNEKAARRQKDNLCSCLPLSIPAVWSIWSTKRSPTDELKDPLLPNVGDETFDEVVREGSKGDCEEVISAQKSGSAASSCLETRDHASLAQSRVDDSFSPSSETSQNCGTIVSASHAAVEIAIVVGETPVPKSSNSATVAAESGNASSQVRDFSVATEWDLLKSIVYGGLTISITSLGVVSSAAGGDAKTLTVIAIGLANLVSGLFLIFNNILDLNHYHQQQFIETVGHSFWFHGFVAIFSYLVFGSLAPVTYGFSFRKSDDKLYKFLGASIVSLVSIILLSLGKARVTKKSYIRVMILYIFSGFFASIIGFFTGEYIRKLLEKWGFVTD